MTLIIAEAGVNHNGQEDLAIQLIDAAHKAGADIVKFQTFKAKSLVNESAGLASYQVKNLGFKESQLSMLTRLELPFDSFKRLQNHCDALGIEFLSTAFDIESLHFLVDELELQRLKIPSGEITNAPLILAHAQTRKNLILSTGMASLAEIEMALGVIAFGYIYQQGKQPSAAGFEDAYSSKLGQDLLKEKVTLLHCTTEYPAPLNEINLRVMNGLREAFDLSVGYSDHSEGQEISIAAVALGAEVIEKHFTLDKKMLGPDHKASLDPAGLSSMISSIRNVEKGLGRKVKAPTESELRNKTIVRKSIVAEREISKDEKFTVENISIKRPGTGQSPYKYWDLLSKYSSRGYSPGDLID